MMNPQQASGLLTELTPTIEESYERHMNSLRTTPIEPMGRLAVITGVEVADPLLYGPELRRSFTDHLNRLARLDIHALPVIGSSLTVNLLTEDNLPHYSIENSKMAMLHEGLWTWLREWITEEFQHGVFIRDYATLAGAIGQLDVLSPKKYSEGLLSQHTNGIEVTLETVAQGFSYLALQELLTADAHRNFAGILDPYGQKVMLAISGDESRHSRFYSSLVQGLLQIDPDHTIIDIRNQFFNFDMPGKLGIPNFNTLARTMSVAGIFDLPTVLRAMAKLSEDWNLAGRTFGSEEARIAQAELLEFLSPDAIAAAEAHMNRARDIYIRKAERDGGPRPFIIGRTVQLVDGNLEPMAQAA